MFFAGAIIWEKPTGASGFWEKSKGCNGLLDEHSGTRQRTGRTLTLSFCCVSPRIGLMQARVLHLPRGCRVLCDKTWKEVAPENYFCHCRFKGLDIYSDYCWWTSKAQTREQEENKYLPHHLQGYLKVASEWHQPAPSTFLDLYVQLGPWPWSSFSKAKTSWLQSSPSLSILKAGLTRKDWGEAGTLSFSFAMGSSAPFNSPTFSLSFLLQSLYLLKLFLMRSFCCFMVQHNLYPLCWEQWVKQAKHLLPSWLKISLLIWVSSQTIGAANTTDFEWSSILTSNGRKQSAGHSVLSIANWLTRRWGSQYINFQLNVGLIRAPVNSGSRLDTTLTSRFHRAFWQSMQI